VATISIRALAGGGFGPLDGPFTLIGEPHDPQNAIIDTVIFFARHVAAGITFYNNQTGFADSSLFKSFAGECFAELESEDPQSAALLCDLVVDCRDLNDTIYNDKTWQLHRAIFATLPGVRFLE
jgi:hypothetical protein